MAGSVLIIANPVSGGGKGAALAARLRAELEQLGHAVEVWETTLQRTGRALARDVAPGGFSSVVVVGGDGSLHDCLAGLRDDTPVGLLPAGTANVWAKEAGIPRRPRRVAALVHRARALETTLAEAGGEPFFLFVGAGLDARIVRRVEAVRRRRGHRGGMLQWIAPAAREFVPRPLADLSVTVDGQRLTGLSQVLVTRVRSYAGWARMPAGIDIRDDRLHVLAFPQRRKTALLAAGLRAALGALRPGRDVLHVPTSGPVRIEAAHPAEPFHLDGDDHGDLPVEITPGHRAARLLVP